MAFKNKFEISGFGTVKINSRAEYDDLITTVIAMIHEPESIPNTNRFASHLTDINDKRFIEPLINKISSAVPSETMWLADYLYALINLLDECDEYYSVHEDVVHLLGNWLLNTGGGEISWKVGSVLSKVKCSATKEYMMKGATDESLLYLTRISCIGGIVNQFTNDAKSLLQSLEYDSSQEVRDACRSAMAHLNSKE